MKWLTIFCGLLMGWGILLGGSAMAGSECSLETELTSSVEAVETVPPAPSAETVVIISGSSESVGSEVVIRGGPSQSVRVTAPSHVTVTAIGGDGPAGTPGTPAAGSEVVVKGGPSQDVRVIAPSNVSVTAIGGDGPAGTPGTPGNQIEPDRKGQGDGN